jgi:hypothetical protein
LVNNSTNINKTKESLNSDGVNNSININKTKESLNSDSQQFYKYQQNKRKYLNFLCFVDIGGIVDHHYLNFLLFC